MVGEIDARLGVEFAVVGTVPAEGDGVDLESVTVPGGALAVAAEEPPAVAGPVDRFSLAGEARMPGGDLGKGSIHSLAPLGMFDTTLPTGVSKKTVGREDQNWPMYTVYLDEQGRALMVHCFQPMSPQCIYVARQGEPDAVSYTERKRSDVLAEGDLSKGSELRLGEWTYSRPVSLVRGFIDDPIIRDAFDPRISFDDLLTRHRLVAKIPYRSHDVRIDAAMWAAGIYNGS